MVSIKLKEDTEILLNKARSKVIIENPNIKRFNDDIIKHILKKYLGVGK